MLRLAFQRCFFIVAVASGALSPLQGTAVEPPPQETTKPDWAGLDRLLSTGDYANAATAADEMATALRPQRRDPDFLPRSIGFVRALMRRGYAESRLGKLDAAAETFDQALRTVKDQEFRRLVTLESRRANARTAAALVDLEIMLVELADLRMGVIVERLRAAREECQSESGLSPEQITRVDEQVAGWLDDLDVMRKNATQARKSLTERIDQAGPAVLASPYSRALAGPFRLALVAGVAGLECRRLPQGVETTGTTRPAAADARDWIGEPRERFAEASRALDEAIAAAVPKGEAGMRPEQRAEALVMRAELLMCEGQELVAAGEPAQGRERFVKAVELVEQIASLRKLSKPESHPDLFGPLLGLAEATLDEARLLQEEGDPALARETMLKASALLSRADALALPPDHPRRRGLAGLRARIDEELARVASTIPGSDAAHTAARRLRQALDGTAMSDADPRP